ncbi:ORF2 [Simian torque teno virus 33]|uniref:ORF2 n=1 Tax=Simian torque teno virus 33 TaxID=1629656 RepID=UPI0005D7E411|nr:ORF2 [Simian torque teno virus 33]AJP36576.1 ORF2 [Simian torque teno virus 33]
MYFQRRRRSVYGRKKGHHPRVQPMFWKAPAEDEGAREERWLRSVVDGHAAFCACRYPLAHLSYVHGRHSGAAGQARTPPAPRFQVASPSPVKPRPPPPTPASDPPSRNRDSGVWCGSEDSGTRDAGDPAARGGVDDFSAEDLEDLFRAVEEDAAG